MCLALNFKYLPKSPGPILLAIPAADAVISSAGRLAYLSGRRGKQFMCCYRSTPGNKYLRPKAIPQVVECKIHVIESAPLNIIDNTGVISGQKNDST